MAKSKKLNKAKIYLHGTVNDKMLDKFIFDCDKAIALGVKELYVEITSTGGDVYSGFAIYNKLKAYPGTVITIANSCCMSAAVLIYAAGEARLTYKNTNFMVHEFYSEMSGKSANNLNASRQMIKEQLTYCKILANISKLTTQQWYKLLKRETYFSYETAIKFGLSQSEV